MTMNLDFVRVPAYRLFENVLYARHTVGDSRTRRAFIVFKKTINGKTRSWRMTSWKETCVEVLVTPFGTFLIWEPVEWAD